MSLKEKILIKYTNAKETEKIKQSQKEAMRNKVFNQKTISSIIDIINKINENRENKRNKDYDKETRKIINNLPNLLSKFASNGCDYVDVHQYKYNFFTNPYLYCHMGKYYLDKRGHNIVKYLKENGFYVSFPAHNHTFESYYTIRVHFQ